MIDWMVYQAKKMKELFTAITRTKYLKEGAKKVYTKLTRMTLNNKSNSACNLVKTITKHKKILNATTIIIIYHYSTGN